MRDDVTRRAAKTPGNPLVTPGNPLTDVLPARWRAWLYAALTLAGIVFAAWQASDGDWRNFVAGLVTTLVAALAVSNTGGSAP